MTSARRRINFAAPHRHRLSRSGSRQLNAIIYRIALTQAHHSPQARAYLARRISQGKTRREAHRALRRYVVRALWHLWTDRNRLALEVAA
jgi:hypothetical protein